jgi:hypothetical protein
MFTGKVFYWAKKQGWSFRVWAPSGALYTRGDGYASKAEALAELSGLARGVLIL